MTASRWPRSTWSSAARATCWGPSQSGVRSSLRLLRVLDDADLIGQARDIADGVPRRRPGADRSRPGRHRHRGGAAGRGRVAGAHVRRGSSPDLSGRAAAAGWPCRPATAPGRPPTGSGRRCSRRSRPGPVARPAPPTSPWTGWPFCDLYAGSGAVGLEAASRGAAPVLLVESSRRARGRSQQNVAAVGLDVDVRRAASRTWSRGSRRTRSTRLRRPAVRAGERRGGGHPARPGRQRLAGRRGPGGPRAVRRATRRRAGRRLERHWERSTARRCSTSASG